METPLARLCRLVPVLVASFLGVHTARLAGAEVTVLTQGAPLIDPIAVVRSPDGATLYLTDYGAGAVFKMPSAGGPATLLASGPNLADTRGLAVSPDGATLYVGGWGRSEVVRVSTATGAVSVVAAGGGMVTPQGLAVSPDGNTLYVADEYAGAVFKVPAAGGAPVVFAAGAPWGTAYAGPFALCLTPDGSTLYINAGASGIFRTPTASAAVEAVTTGQFFAGAMNLSADGTELIAQVFLDGGPGTFNGPLGLVFIPLNGGPQKLGIISPRGSTPGFGALTPDGRTLFLADTGYLDRYGIGPAGQAGKIFRYDLAGSNGPSDCAAQLAALMAQLQAALARIQDLEDENAALTTLNQQLSQQAADALAQLQGALATIQNLQNQNAALTALNQQLAQQAGATAAQLDALRQLLAAVFNNPAFVIPGATPAEQLQNLITAIANLNHGQQQALYRSLGGR